MPIIPAQPLALTPPMGWNSWNCWGLSVDDARVRAAADAFINSGLADHGWTYINIDDCWEIKPGSDDPDLTGQERDDHSPAIRDQRQREHRTGRFQVSSGQAQVRVRPIAW